MDANYFYNRGIDKFEAKDWNGAIADFTEAIQLNAYAGYPLAHPYATYAWVNRGKCYANLENYQQAISDFNIALIMSPELAHEILPDRGIVYEKLGRYEEAIRDLEASIPVFVANGDQANTISLTMVLRAAQINLLNQTLGGNQISKQTFKAKLSNIEKPKNNQSGSQTQVSNTSGDCFIVTATFGTPYSKEVQKYRYFRDRHLVKYAIGRYLIRLYYFWGPRLAIIIRSNIYVKKVMSRILSTLSKFLPTID